MKKTTPYKADRSRSGRLNDDVKESAVRLRSDDNGGQPADEGSERTQLGTRFFDSQGNLSSSRQRLLRQIIDESNETFFLSSREMGRRYNVDSATIIRTVQALGYEKFADFAQDL